MSAWEQAEQMPVEEFLSRVQTPFGYTWEQVRDMCRSGGYGQESMDLLDQAAEQGQLVHPVWVDTDEDGVEFIGDGTHRVLACWKAGCAVAWTGVKPERNWEFWQVSYRWAGAVEWVEGEEFDLVSSLPLAGGWATCDAGVGGEEGGHWYFSVDTTGDSESELREALQARIHVMGIELCGMERLLEDEDAL